MTSSPEFFKTATGHTPYPYQWEFATRPELPALVSVPTGCGATAAVILAWLWHRLARWVTLQLHGERRGR